MELDCPDCRQHLRLADELASRVIRCPRCGAIFRLTAAADRPQANPPQVTAPARVSAPSLDRRREPISKELYLAIDVSTSTRKSQREIHAHLTASLAQIRQSGPFSLAIYLFHRHVMPFPSEALCRPLPFEQAVIPTLADLEQRVGAGTAILDAVDRLVEHALAEQAANPQPVDRRVILLTDGWERSSKLTDAAGLMAKLARVRRQIDVSLTGFVDGRSYGCLVDLVRDLDLPEESWAFARHRGDEDSIHDSICDMSLELVKFAVLPEPPRRSDSSHRTPKVDRSSSPPVWAENPSGFSSSDFHGVGAS